MTLLLALVVLATTRKFKYAFFVHVHNEINIFFCYIMCFVVLIILLSRLWWDVLYVLGWCQIWHCKCLDANKKRRLDTDMFASHLMAFVVHSSYWRVCIKTLANNNAIVSYMMVILIPSATWAKWYCRMWLCYSPKCWVTFPWRWVLQAIVIQVCLAKRAVLDRE